MQMLKETGIKISSVRLDRYYSHPCDVNLFPNSKVYIIPRTDAKLGHGIHWYETMKSFVEDTMKYLEEYFKRENEQYVVLNVVLRISLLHLKYFKKT